VNQKNEALLLDEKKGKHFFPMEGIAGIRKEGRGLQGRGNVLLDAIKNRSPFGEKKMGCFWTACEKRAKEKRGLHPFHGEGKSSGNEQGLAGRRRWSGKKLKGNLFGGWPLSSPDTGESHWIGRGRGRVEWRNQYTLKLGRGETFSDKEAGNVIASARRGRRHGA